MYCFSDSTQQILRLALGCVLFPFGLGVYFLPALWSAWRYGVTMRFVSCALSPDVSVDPLPVGGAVISRPLTDRIHLWNRCHFTHKVTRHHVQVRIRNGHRVIAVHGKQTTLGTGLAHLERVLSFHGCRIIATVLPVCVTVSVLPLLICRACIFSIMSG